MWARRCVVSGSPASQQARCNRHRLSRSCFLATAGYTQIPSSPAPFVQAGPTQVTPISRRTTLATLATGLTAVLAPATVAADTPQRHYARKSDLTSILDEIPEDVLPPVQSETNGTGPNGTDTKVTQAPLEGETLSEEAAKRLSAEEEERSSQRKKKRGRIRELEEKRAELAEKELELLEKEQELLQQEQTLAVLKEELELEKRLRTLLTKEKEKAEEQAKLAIGLCAGGTMLP